MVIPVPFRKTEEHPASAAARKAVALGREAHAKKWDAIPAHIQELRALVDGNDAALLAALRRRLTLVRAIAFAKGIAGMAAHDQERENDLLNRLTPTAGPERDIYREVIRACRETVRPIVEAGLPDPVPGGDPQPPPDRASGR